MTLPLIRTGNEPSLLTRCRSEEGLYFCFVLFLFFLGGVERSFCFVLFCLFSGGWGRRGSAIDGKIGQIFSTRFWSHENWRASFFLISIFKFSCQSKFGNSERVGRKFGHVLRPLLRERRSSVSPLPLKLYCFSAFLFRVLPSPWLRKYSGTFTRKLVFISLQVKANLICQTNFVGENYLRRMVF